VLALNGSARLNGNTAALLRVAMGECETAGIETELVQLAGQAVRGCTGCGACARLKNRRCIMTDDMANEIMQKIFDADGILVGTPTYYANATPEILGLMARACMVSGNNGDLLRRKVGAAVVAVRRAGAVPAFDAVNHFFFISEMIVPGSSYWNLGIGRLKDEVDQDAEGVETMRNLGRNMAWLLGMLNAGKE
ncbi:MAG: flavodoxin family protein, partial [Candidatus Cryosericum sp.]